MRRLDGTHKTSENAEICWSTVKNHKESEIIEAGDSLRGVVFKSYDECVKSQRGKDARKDASVT